MFFGCSSLKELPDISIWNTNNVNYMGEIFYNLFEIENLPDISKWNISNVHDIGGIFSFCSSLI